MSSWCHGDYRATGDCQLPPLPQVTDVPPVCCSSFGACTQEQLLMAGGMHLHLSIPPGSQSFSPSPSPPLSCPRPPQHSCWQGLEPEEGHPLH